MHINYAKCNHTKRIRTWKLQRWIGGAKLHLQLIDIVWNAHYYCILRALVVVAVVVMVQSQWLLGLAGWLGDEVYHGSSVWRGALVWCGVVHGVIYLPYVAFVGFYISARKLYLVSLTSSCANTQNYTLQIFSSSSYRLRSKRRLQQALICDCLENVWLCHGSFSSVQRP